MGTICQRFRIHSGSRPFGRGKGRIWLELREGAPVSGRPPVVKGSPAAGGQGQIEPAPELEPHLRQGAEVAEPRRRCKAMLPTLAASMAPTLACASRWRGAAIRARITSRPRPLPRCAAWTSPGVPPCTCRPGRPETCRSGRGPAGCPDRLRCQAPEIRPAPRREAHSGQVDQPIDTGWRPVPARITRSRIGPHRWLGGAGHRGGCLP